jgi:spoIIIJ-associated protein
MKDYEATGRTLDEAIDKAITALGIRKENAEIKIIDEPAQGLLGIIGSKEARVMVKVKENPVDYIVKYMDTILHIMDIEGEINIREDDEKLDVMILGQDVGVLIGRRGRTLSEIQYLLNVTVRRQFNSLNKMVVLDIENYRSRREKTLTQLAKNVARKVSQDGKEQTLEPMTPQERRVIHIALQDYPDIMTYSKGQEPHRKVVVAPR